MYEISPFDYTIVPGRRKKEPSAINVPASFDIETCSFYLSDKGKAITCPEFYRLSEKEQKHYQKRACLVAWGFGLVDKVYFGRTWKELVYFLYTLKNMLNLDPDNLILPVAVHNLSYEYQWIRKRYEWIKVFATDERQPIRALTSLGIEFRDTLILSGFSLDLTAKSLTKYKVDKMVGDWDYYALRGGKTPLTEKEWGYLRNDNVILLNYIHEWLDERGSINKIPMTKTGIVREDVRNACFWESKSHKKDKNNKYADYLRLMKALRFTSLEEYQLCKLGFHGGFTHANCINAGLIIEDVVSKDITSSYPTCMLSELYPMSTGKRVIPQSKKEFQDYLDHYCCLIDIMLFDVESIFPWEHIISRSKCLEIKDQIVDNGRVVSASYLRIVITDVDLQCFKKFYTWKRTQVAKMYIYQRGYLPKSICEKALEYYEMKTTLKGVEGKEAEYARYKTMVNSLFGMMVYDPLKDEITYSNEDGWGKEEKDKEEQINQYNNSKSRFLSFQHGLFITSYAMRNVLSAILELKEDYQYCDTDSVKYTNPEKHENFFRWYNNQIARKIRKCLQYHGLDVSRACPKSIDGEPHPLGYFDDDGKYARFCTLGAKRYAYDKGEEYPEEKRYSLTISGVNKSKAIPSIIEKMKEEHKDFFDFFKFGIIYDRETCGKKLHTYIDEEIKGSFIDKDGILNEFDEFSCVHLEDTTYEMTANDDYLSILRETHEIEYIGEE